MPKNTAKDTTNKSTPVSVTAADALGLGDGRGRPKQERELTPDEQVAVRTEPSAATALDGRYRKEFMLKVPEYGSFDDAEYDSFHEANKLVTIESAFHAGLHPKAEATFDGERETPQIGQTLLVYSVEVVPAGADETHELTVTPSSSLAAQDGANTMSDKGVNPR